MVICSLAPADAWGLGAVWVPQRVTSVFPRRRLRGPRGGAAPAPGLRRDTHRREAAPRRLVGGLDLAGLGVFRSCEGLCNTCSIGSIS